MWCEKCYTKLPQEIQPLDDEHGQTITEVGNKSSSGAAVPLPPKLVTRVPVGAAVLLPPTPAVEQVRSSYAPK